MGVLTVLFSDSTLIIIASSFPLEGPVLCQVVSRSDTFVLLPSMPISFSDCLWDQFHPIFEKS